MPWNHDQPHAGFTTADQTPWLPIPNEHLERAADLQTGAAATGVNRSLFHQTRSLIALHRTRHGFHSDRLQVLESPDELLVFERGEGNNRLLCVFNLSDAPIAYQFPETWAHRQRLESGGTVTSKPESSNTVYEGWSWEWLESPSSP